MEHVRPGTLPIAADIVKLMLAETNRDQFLQLVRTRRLTSFMCGMNCHWSLDLHSAIDESQHVYMSSEFHTATIIILLCNFFNLSLYLRIHLSHNPDFSVGITDIAAGWVSVWGHTGQSQRGGRQSRVR